jgi:hypothetical protein
VRVYNTFPIPSNDAIIPSPRQYIQSSGYPPIVYGMGMMIFALCLIILVKVL